MYKVFELFMKLIYFGVYYDCYDYDLIYLKNLFIVVLLGFLVR